MRTSPAVVLDSRGPKLFVLQCLNNMHRPGLGLQGGHGHPGGAGAQDAEVLIDHPSGLPAGPGAKPVPHTRS